MFPHFPIIYDIPGYGYRFSREHLGRPPALSHRPIMQAASYGRSLYLRTEMFYQFTGSAWRAIPDISSLTQTPQGTLTNGLYVLPFVSSWLEQQTHVQRAEITTLEEYLSMVPHTNDTAAFSVSQRQDLSLVSPPGIHGYQLEEPLYYGETITLYYGIPKDPWIPDDLLLENSLALPDNIPESIQELAQTLQGETDRDTILNILGYLREDFVYTLKPPQPRIAEEFLYTFLEDHRSGFCVHFATACVLLCRLQGIPARYVTGFRVPSRAHETGGYGSVTVTGYNAHAWCEVWSPETGWYLVEATPPMQPYGYEDTFFDRFYAIRDEGHTLRQLSEILAEEITLPETPGITPDIPSFPFWLIIIPAGGAVAAAASYLRRRSTIDRRFHIQVKKLHAVTVKAGFPAPEVYGWTRWASPSRRHSGRAASIILEVTFGGRAPAKRDIRFLQRYRKTCSSARGPAGRSTLPLWRGMSEG